ncbi:hypothetical protein [Endozoicomonas sp. SCSIO W0465]|uniref:hypothetical protein n=1 Tax=Endozoicomonas sp. SCSIO W0465 TaxID=2918516 RepID=UPI002074E3C9|nr:hypothetical protein [Endozoicomonas sp. SCSIO W0465]USE35633.1 hypothetical protein MJO57_26735 [Endozoicomonas sp. SCSIO W0465]
MLANIVEKWCLRGWYKNQKIPDLCGGAEQLPPNLHGVPENPTRQRLFIMLPDPYAFPRGAWERGVWL